MVFACLNAYCIFLAISALWCKGILHFPSYYCSLLLSGMKRPYTSLIWNTSQLIDLIVSSFQTPEADFIIKWCNSVAEVELKAPEAQM